MMNSMTLSELKEAGKIKGIIFDMDGTLFDSEKIWRDMWCHLPLEYGYEKNPLLGEDFCGTSGEEARNVVRRHYPELDAVEFVNRGRNRYKECIYKQQPEEMVGFRDIISYMNSQGYKMAIASGSPKELIELNLERAGMKEYFQAFVSGDSVPNGKPAPDIMIEAARQIGIAPENCLVVEDGENGILSAKAAGCYAVMVPDLTEPDDQMKDICIGIYPTLFDIIKAFEA